MSSVGNSAYWSATAAEYGVAAPKTLPPVHLEVPAPRMLGAPDVEEWLTQQLDGSHAEWPPPDPSNVYVIFYPATTTLSFPFGTGESCVTFGGYHMELTLPSGMVVQYAAVIRCDQLPPSVAAGSPLGLDSVTAIASHELLEVMTDPHPVTNPAYLKANDWDWSRAGEEVGDLCVAATAPAQRYTRPDDVGYLVQRTWSNRAALAGKHPCVPAPAGEAYFNSVPIQDEYTSIPNKTMEKARAVRIAVGQSKTIDVELFGDATKPWNVEAIDGWGELGDPRLMFTWDRSSGSSGDKLHLTIRVLAPAPKDSGYYPFRLRSTLGSVTNVWYGMVVN
jgi:hypothetical protein